MWKRLMDHKGVPKGCGICEFLTVEGMLKCLRLMKGLKIEEDYELSVNLGPKTEAFLRYWRETKKLEWIEAKHRAGLPVDIQEIERKENNGEPLEWELEIISKDYEARLEIENILNNRVLYDEVTDKTGSCVNLVNSSISVKLESNSIKENCSVNSGNENIKPEDSDKKEFTPCGFITSGVQTLLKQKNETFKSKERLKNKKLLLQKLENKYKEELKKWGEIEEKREQRRQEERNYLSNIHKKRLKLYEADTQYYSDEEKDNKRRNEYYYKEKSKTRNNEMNIDKLLRYKLKLESLKEYELFFSKLELISRNDNNFNNLSKNHGEKLNPSPKIIELECKEVEDDHIINLKDNIRNHDLSETRITNSLNEVEQHGNNIINDNNFLVNKKRKKVIVQNENEDLIYKKKEDTLNQDFLTNNPYNIYNTKNNLALNLDKKEENAIKETRIKEKNPEPIDIIELQKIVYDLIPKNKKDLFNFNVPWTTILEVSFNL
jgi:hypothetical protein